LAAEEAAEEVKAVALLLGAGAQHGHQDRLGLCSGLKCGCRPDRRSNAQKTGKQGGKTFLISPSLRVECPAASRISGRPWVYGLKCVKRHVTRGFVTRGRDRNPQ